jgi:hypothetical protein
MSVPPQLGETPLTSPIKPPELHQPSSADVDLILQNYFQKKGYHPNELAYIREHNLISLEQLSKQLKNNQDNDYIKVVQDYENGHIDAIEQSYASLIEWVDNALDLYKVHSRHTYQEPRELTLFLFY